MKIVIDSFAFVYYGEIINHHYINKLSTDD